MADPAPNASGIRAILDTIEQTKPAIADFQKTLDAVDAAGFTREVTAAVKSVEVKDFTRSMKASLQEADLPGFGRDVRDALRSGDISTAMEGIKAAIVRHDIPGLLTDVRDSVHRLGLPEALGRINQAFAGLDADRVLGSAKNVLDAAGFEGAGNNLVPLLSSWWQSIGTGIGKAEGYAGSLNRITDQMAGVGDQMREFADGPAPAALVGSAASSGSPAIAPRGALVARSAAAPVDAAAPEVTDTSLRGTIHRTREAVGELKQTIDEVRLKENIAEVQAAVNALDLSGFATKVKGAYQQADLPGFAADLKTAFAADSLSGMLAGFQTALTKHDIPGFLRSIQGAVHELDLPGFLERITQVYANFDISRLLGSVKGVLDALGFEGAGENLTKLAMDAWNGIGSLLGFAQDSTGKLLNVVDQVASAGQVLQGFMRPTSDQAAIPTSVPNTTAIGEIAAATAPLAELGLEADGLPSVEAVDPANDPELLAQQQRDEYKLAQLQEYQDQAAVITDAGQQQQTEVHAAGTERQQATDKLSNEQKLGFASKTFGALSSLMSSKNKELFQIGKASAIAQATVDTYAGATKAFATVPYPFNFAVAASVVAAGVANIATIASTSFGGSGGGGGGAAPTPAATAATAPPTTSQTGGPAGPGRRITINLTGSRFSREDVEDLIRKINEAGGDGADTITSG